MPRLVRRHRRHRHAAGRNRRGFGVCPQVPVVRRRLATMPAGAAGVGVVADGERIAVARHVGRHLRRQRASSAPIRRARCMHSATACPICGTRCRSISVGGVVHRLGRTPDRREPAPPICSQRASKRCPGVANGPEGVPPLPLGRTHAAQRCAGPRRLPRTSTTRPTPTGSRRRCSKASRSRWPTDSTCCAKPVPQVERTRGDRRRRALGLLGRASLAAAMETRRWSICSGGEVGPALGAARLAQVAVDGGTPGRSLHRAAGFAARDRIPIADPRFARLRTEKQAAFRRRLPAHHSPNRIQG